MQFSLENIVFTRFSSIILNPFVSVWYCHLPSYSNIETQVTSLTRSLHSTPLNSFTEGTNKHTETHAVIATYRLNRPRGQFSENTLTYRLLIGPYTDLRLISAWLANLDLPPCQLRHLDRITTIIWTMIPVPANTRGSNTGWILPISRFQKVQWVQQKNLERHYNRVVVCLVVRSVGCNAGPSWV